MRHFAPLEALEPRRLCAAHWSYIVGKTFRGTPKHEALELLGVTRRVYVDCTFELGTTDCRCNGCRWLSFIKCRFRLMRGPADPDGSGLQLINSGDVLISRCEFDASPFASDLLSNFGDRPTAGVVTVEGCTFRGAGRAPFSTSVCQDGPSPSDLVLRRDVIRGARCAVTVAAGAATILELKTIGCGCGVFVASLYGTTAHVLTDHPTGVLLGAGGSVGGVLTDPTNVS